MADTKISALAADGTLHTDDLFVVVDTHDTSMAASGTDKNLTPLQLFAALTGDVAYSGFAGTIANGAVTLSKMAAGTANSILGYNVAGVPINITQGTNVTIAGGTISASGGGGTPGGSAGQIQWNSAASFGGFTMSGDATLVTSTGVITIGAGAITLAKMANFTSVSLMGNPTGSPAAPSAITLGANLSFSGTTLVASTGGAANPGGSANQIQYNAAGTAFAGFTMSGDATLVVATGVITVASIGGKAVTLGGTLTLSGAFNTTITVTAGTSVTLPTSGTLLSTAAAVTPAQGGTGLATLTAHAVLLGEGTSNVAFATIGTAGRILVDAGAGADPAFVAVSGTGTLTSAGVLDTTGPYKFTAVLGLGAVITTGTNSTGNYLVCPFSGSFTRWDMVCPTAAQPSGASLVVDVMKSASGAGSFTSLWASNPGNRPTITTGTNNGGSATAFDTTTFAAGDVLRFDVITAGGGAVQNVTLVISSRMHQ